MEKEEIVQLLDSSYTSFIEFVLNSGQEFWLSAPPNKWTTGQHTLHLLQSTKPLNLALSLPKVLIRWKYGTSNRSPRSYQQVVMRYKERLAENQGKVYKASENMGFPDHSEKSYLLDRLQVESKKLQYKTQHLSDKALDKYILPHPLMGKMPFREIIMWSAYHAEHHLQTLKTYEASSLQIQS